MTDYNPSAGNAPARPVDTSRRSILMGAPAAALALAAGGAAATAAKGQGGQTPIMQLFREWEEIERLQDLPETSEEEVERLSDVKMALEDRIIALRSTCAADFAAKVCAFTSFGIFEINENSGENIWAEARQLLAA